MPVVPATAGAAAAAAAAAGAGAPAPSGVPTAAEIAAREEADTRSVYVGNVDYAVTPEELQQHFSVSVALCDLAPFPWLDPCIHSSWPVWLRLRATEYLQMFTVCDR